MKFYELTFMDTERGKIRRWKTSKKAIRALVANWKTRYPLRALLLTTPVEIKGDKRSVVEYLNQNCGGD